MRFRGFGGGSGGGGTVTSVTNSDGTITVSGTAAAPVVSLNLAHANTWTAQQTFLTGAAGSAPVIFRETGGVAGTDEVQFYYAAGTPFGAIYNVKASGYQHVFQVAGVSYLTVSASSVLFGSKATDGGFWQIASQTAAFGVFSGGQYSWSSTGSAAGSPDTGIKRVAAGVVGPTDGSSGSGWFQNTAGTARLTAPVTNVTTTLANLTDLTVTLVAGRKYVGRLVLIVDEGLAADGFKFDLNGGTATMTSVTYGFSSAIGATLGTRTSTAIATAITLTALADTNDVILEVPVTLVCNAGGTLIPRQAKNADAAGGTLTMRTGCYLVLNDSPN